MRRIAATGTVAVGIVLIVLPLVTGMFERTRSSEQILDRFEFLTSDGNPDRYLDEAVVTREGSTELVERTIPRLGAAAGLDERELARRYPAYAAARTEVPEARDFSVRYSEQLEAVKAKFASVYDIPVAWLPLTSTPWLFLLSGVACLAAGAWALRGSRAPLIAITVLGALMLAGPLALGAFAKSRDAEDVKDFAEKGLTERASNAAQTASRALDDLAAESEAKTLPELTGHSAAADLAASNALRARYPEAAAFLEQWPAIGPRLARLADAVRASYPDFEDDRKLPIAFPIWLLMGAGALLACLGALAMREPTART